VLFNQSIADYSEDLVIQKKLVDAKLKNLFWLMLLVMLCHSYCWAAEQF
jgi:hypothetical protein